ncbi:S8 family serine peptidase [Chloroflexota bacterium]
MRRCLIILGFLALITQLFSGSIYQTGGVQAQESDEGGKISSLLSLQVEAKLRAVEAGGMQAALETSLQAGHVDILQAQGIRLVDLDKQRIFIHSLEELGQSQVEELESMGLTLYLDSWIPPVGAHPTGFITADMPIDKLDQLAAREYIVRLDTAERFLEFQNDLAIQKTNTDDVWSLGYDGTGVTIAVLDSGLDVTHNDIPTPVASKDYSNYPTLDDTIANTYTGHGTHVTGIALGRGTQSGGTYKGSAPGADLIFLKIGKDDGGIPVAAATSATKDAVDIYNADIISSSHGSWDTYHDGTSQEAQAVDYAVSQGAVVFISAGNAANDDQHYSGTVSASSETGFIQVNVTEDVGTNTALAYNLVWYDGIGTSNDLELTYYNSSYTLLASTDQAQTQSSRGTESETSYHDYYITNGTFYLKVTNNSANEQFFHIYYSSAYNRTGSGSVTFQNADPDYTIGSPAGADSAIAVGAYNTRQIWYDYANNDWWFPDDPVDQISTFSSRGPRVDTGAPPKPNIVAPGCGIISCRDNDVYTWPGGASYRYIDNDGPNTNDPTKNDGNGPADYYLMRGTSMACPHAAGVAALLLDKNPTLTPAQVKEALETTATDKGSPGHDNSYGLGLINAYSAITPPTMEAIVEAEGQYYNTAPSFSNFGFDDAEALDDGWYQMDSYAGSWTALFTDAPGTSWDDDGWTILGFDALSEGSHTIYFKASDDDGLVVGESGEWSWQFFKDTTPPADPTGVSSTSHTTSVWSNDNTVDITWADAIDNNSGLDGYSVLWDTDPATIPDQSEDVDEGVQATTSSALADGNSHYFHISGVDNAGNWQSTVHLGPFFINTTLQLVVTTFAADNITASSAILNGSLDSLGDYSSANVSFEWGTTSGALDQETTPQAMASTDNFSAEISELASDTPHYFRTKAIGSATFYGDELSFITEEIPTSATAVRTLDCVNWGEQFEVGIAASDFGAFGQLIEIPPTSFTYVADSATAVSGIAGDEVLVAVDGQDVSFTFLVGAGETDISFTYDVTASDTAGTYYFAGVLNGQAADVDPITGDTEVVGCWTPLVYDTDESGVIEIIEVLSALTDYFGGQITIMQALQVIGLYFSG